MQVFQGFVSRGRYATALPHPSAFFPFLFSASRSFVTSYPSVDLADGLHPPKCSTVVESRFSRACIDLASAYKKSDVENVGTSHPELADIIARR